MRGVSSPALLPPSMVRLSCCFREAAAHASRLAFIASLSPLPAFPLLCRPPPVLLSGLCSVSDDPMLWLSLLSFGIPCRFF